MAGFAHPRDDVGRVSPDPGWPADRRAPGDLEFLRRFVNTRNRENGADRLVRPEDVAAFLDGEGRVAFVPDQAGHRRLLGLREALHDLALGNGRPAPSRAPATEGLSDGPDAAFSRVATTTRPNLSAILEHAAVALAVDDTGGTATLRVVPAAAGGAERLLVELALVVVDAQRTGTWDRLKACQHCAWVVYDASRNRSGRWCSMQACGGRHNARAYRRRQRRA